MKIAMTTLGCKVNQYETQALLAEAVRRGHLVVPFDGPADVYLVNTCTVTDVASRKSRYAIRKAKEHGGLVAVCGCYPQTAPQAVAALGVDLVAGSGNRLLFLDAVEQLFRDRSAPRPTLVDDAMTRRVFESLPAGGQEGRTRAFLKIEDGCCNFCSYCIIPYARGPVRSLPLEEAVAQGRLLAEEGYRELVLTGIEISSWGADFGGDATLIDLMEALSAAAPGLRLRLGSLEPRTITEDFCRRAAALPGLCPQFHLSLQSGSDGTLARMRRKYDTRRYLQSVALLRDYFPQPGITTDVIVGFPGETDEEFGESMSFLQQCGFSAVHIFPYSRRPGTPAADLPHQVPAPLRETRVSAARALARTLETAYRQTMVGKTFPVLFETEKAGLWQGHAPNHVEVFAPGTGLHNEIRSVCVTGLRPGGVIGQLAPQ